MSARLLSRMHNLWIRLWNCTSAASHPSATLTDAYGRRWALWCDGRWVHPATVEATARVALLEQLNATGPARRPAGVDPDLWAPAAALADGPCLSCAEGMHDGCNGIRVVGSHWGPCACGCLHGRDRWAAQQ